MSEKLLNPTGVGIRVPSLSIDSSGEQDVLSATSPGGMTRRDAVNDMVVKFTLGPVISIYEQSNRDLECLFLEVADELLKRNGMFTWDGKE